MAKIIINEVIERIGRDEQGEFNYYEFKNNSFYYQLSKKALELYNSKGLELYYKDTLLTQENLYTVIRDQIKLDALVASAK